MMTIDEVEHAVSMIRANADDDEVAHGMEDDLRTAVLLAVANGATNARELAAAALKTKDIRFHRWCA